MCYDISLLNCSPQVRRMTPEQIARAFRIGAVKLRLPPNLRTIRELLDALPQPAAVGSVSWAAAAQYQADVERLTRRPMPAH